MPARKILQLGNPFLRERSVSITDVTAREVQQTITDLADTLAAFRQQNGFGRAISAVQIGMPLRLIYLQITQPVVLINPVITDLSAEKMQLWDDCFSFPNPMVKLERAAQIKVQYLDATGTTVELSAAGDLSELLQHEIDHLDGILAVDRALDQESLCLREEWERRYRQLSLTIDAS